MSAPGFAAGVRAVAFDAGNTLLWIDHARFAEMVTEAGHAVGESDVRAAEMRARPRLDPLLGKVSKRETPGVYRTHIAYVLEHLDIEDPDVLARATDALADAWKTLWCRPPADAHATLAALRDRGYGVSCLSNSNGTVDRLLAEADLLPLLDDVVDSGVVGFEKPDPRIFELAAERLGRATGEVVYVGDLHALDVVGPHGAGMHAILLDPMDVWSHTDAVRVRALSDLLDWFPGPRA